VRYDSASRPQTIILSLALILASAWTPHLRAAQSIDGLWDAIVVSNSVEIPFRFEISTKGTTAQGFFFEGDRKVGSTSGTFAEGAVKLEYDFLNTTLDLKLADDQLTGSYRNNRPNARPQDVRMRRFAPVSIGQQDPPSLAGTWEMRRVAEEVTAPRDTRTWNVFLRQSGAEFSGSILRVDGDTGTLEGYWRDGKLVMSHFAGERPNLFEATLNTDGTLAVTLNRNAHYLVVRTGEARAKGIPEPPDPSRYTNVKNPTEPFRFSFPDLTGKTVSNTDAQFQGKVVILAIGGSWCPNCHDEAPFLGELYRDYHAKGLEIVGLMFENDPDPKVSIPRIRTFVKRYDAKYPMLLAGTTNPSPTTKTIAEALPEIVNFGAYPTSIYLGRDGRVRSVHAGFASPATGEEHVRLKKELRALVEQLLSVPAPAKSSAGQ
jgi:thiol-disulfide isomerase/thioredoxin